jgi:ParB family chromosome partitioning protein
MSEQAKGGLGRGLSALLPREQVAPVDDTSDAVRAATATRSHDRAPAVEATLRELAITAIDPNPRQPRTVFDDRELDDLAASIREVGVLQPIIVRPRGGGFELIAGERRLRASLRAGRTTIPSIVRNTADDQLLLDALIENVQRVDLNPLEEAAGYRALLDDLGVTHEQLAARVGRSRAAITNALRLLSLAPEVQRRVIDGDLTAAHARTLAALADTEQQLNAARRVIAESLSVRATEQLVRDLAAATPLTARSAATRAARTLSISDRPAGVLEAERLLAERLDTTVRIEHPTSGRGRIVIEYAGIEDLARLTDAIVMKES